jgi:hypothetical protein
MPGQECHQAKVLTRVTWCETIVLLQTSTTLLQANSNYRFSCFQLETNFEMFLAANVRVSEVPGPCWDPGWSGYSLALELSSQRITTDALDRICVFGFQVWEWVPRYLAGWGKDDL